MRRYLGAAIAALALGLLNAPCTPASVQIGNPCVADDSEPGVTMIVLSNQQTEPYMSSAVPPEHKFVITSWRVQVGPGIDPVGQQLIASHQVAEEEDVMVGASAVETLVPGTNEFPTRIPVSEYDHVGLRGPEETLICNQAMDTAGRVGGSWATGKRRHFEVLINIGVPVVVRVERDEDGDGYGDETQDGCTIHAAVQGPCPILTLIRKFQVRPGAVLIHVTPTADASSLQVLGQVRWRVPRPDGKKRAVVVPLSGGDPRFVPTGSTTTVRVPVPRRVRRHLARLPAKRVLWARLEMTAIDLFGGVARGKINAPLRGRAQRAP